MAETPTCEELLREIHGLRLRERSTERQLVALAEWFRGKYGLSHVDAADRLGFEGWTMVGVITAWIDRDARDGS